MIRYVVGSNPPIQVMKGFIRLTWKSFNVDKVAVIKKGIFIVRFDATDNRDKVLQGNYFFDNKPLIVKPWNPNMDVDKEELKLIPIWIQLKIEFKLWGEFFLLKIMGQIGKPLQQRDNPTRKRDNVQYARVLVEVQLAHAFLDQIYFVNGHGVRTQVNVHYEWKPIECQSCHLLGHATADCKRDKTKHQWVQKPQQNQEEKPKNESAAVQKGSSPQKKNDEVDQ